MRLDEERPGISSEIDTLREMAVEEGVSSVRSLFRERSGLFELVCFSWNHYESQMDKV